MKLANYRAWALRGGMLLALAVALGATAALAQSPPPLPHAFYGDWTIDGNGMSVPGPAGTEVTGYLGGVLAGSLYDTAKGFVPTSEVGKYGGGAPSPGPFSRLFVSDSAGFGGTVTAKFKTPGSTVQAPAAQQAFYVAGADTVLKLTVADNLSPTAAFVYDPPAPREEEAVAFNASASTDDVGICKYQWDFGDGSPLVTSSTCVTLTGAPSPLAAHTYTALGGFDVTLTVRDYVGREHSVTMSLTVTPKEGPPRKPRNLVAVRGNAQATLSWNAPSSDGGHPVTKYTFRPHNVTDNVDLSPVDTPDGSTLTLVFTGLVNGKTYTFTGTATNILGVSENSEPSNPVTPATVPGAPTGVVAVRGNGQATVTWTAPPSNGSAILFYTVTSSPATVAKTTTSTMLVFTGLTNGTSYTLAVRATNGVGAGLAGVSNSVTPATIPTAPTGVLLTPGNAQVTASWNVPGSNGGDPILFYTATASPGGNSVTTTALVLQATITGLTNGTGYTVSVIATNGVGAGPAGVSGSATPATVPGAPLNVTATPGNGQAVVEFDSPLSDGGKPIAFYTVKGFFSTGTESGNTVVVPVGSLGIAAQFNATVPGLTNGVSYFFRVTGTNALGTGQESAPSGLVKPFRVPDPPTGVQAVAGDKQATLSWIAPLFDGGRPVTGYQVTGSPGGGCSVGNVLTCTVSGLANGTAYTFTVRAENLAGLGATSTPSNIVTPAGKPEPPPGAVTAVAGNKQATVKWNAASNGGSPLLTYTVTSTPDGKTATVNGATLEATVGGLTNGKKYFFNVTASNQHGASDPSAPSDEVTPLGVPGAPTALKVTPGDTQVTVEWVPPADTGGSDITANIISVFSGTTAVLVKTVDVGAVTKTDVTGLINGRSYTLKVRAVTDVGEGPDSQASSPVKPATTPGKPLNVKATAGDGSATVTFDAPASDGGDKITEYIVTSDPDGKTAKWTFGSLSVVVKGLKNKDGGVDVLYTFRVEAVNGVGKGPASDPSPAVNPDVAPGPPEVSIPKSPTNQATTTLKVKPPPGADTNWTIRVTGGVATKNVTPIVLGVDNDVVVEFNPVPAGAGSLSHTFEVRIINSLGVQSGPVFRVVVFDDKKPPVPTVSIPKSPTKESKVVLEVGAETGATVKVKLGLKVFSAVAAVPGEKVKIEVELDKNTTNKIEVTATDPAGNTSDPPFKFDVVHDDTKPGRPVIHTVDGMSPDPPLKPTSKLTVIVNATADNGTTITASGGLVEVTKSASTVDMAIPLKPNQDNNLSFTATDAAGNTSEATTVTVKSDTIAPAAPTVEAPAITKSVDGKVSVKVQAETNSTITISVGVPVLTGTATGGQDTFLVQLNMNNENNGTVKATDAAGNASSSVAWKTVHDNMSPVLLDGQVSTPVSPTSETSVTFSVTGEPGATIFIEGGAEPMAVKATGDAQNVVVPLKNGSNTVKVKVVDAAGNASNEVSRIVEVITDAPAAPAVSTPFSPTSANKVTLIVTPPPGALASWKIRITGGLNAVEKNVVLPVGPQAIDVDLNLNANNLLSTVVVNEVNLVSAAVVRGVGQDSQKPDSPVVSTLPDITSASSVTLTVDHPESGVTIEVKGGLSTVTAVVASTVNVVVNLKLDQDNLLTVRAIDAAGNKSLAVSMLVTQDSTPPPLSVAPVAPLTQSPTINVNLTTEFGAAITLTGGVSSVSAVGTGSPQNVPVGLVAATPADVLRTITVLSTDAAGNGSIPVTFQVRHDTLPPAPPTVNACGLGITTCPQTLAPFVAVKVKAATGTTIKIAGGSSLVSVLATGSEQTANVPLAASKVNVLLATATDGAGNVSSPPVTVQVPRGPAETTVRGRVVASAGDLGALAGAAALAISTADGSTKSVGINPADGTFVIDKLNPLVEVLPGEFQLQEFRVAVRMAGTDTLSYYKAGALGNLVGLAASATLVKPGATGVFLEMSVLQQPVITAVSGGGGNDAPRLVTADGTGLANASELWLVFGKRTILVAINSATSTQVVGTTELGAKAGVYNLRVRTPAGLSALSASTVTITEVVNLPIVNSLSQTVVVRGTTPTMTLSGVNLATDTKVAIEPSDALITPLELASTTLKLVVPATLPEGTYTFRVTTNAGTGPSSPSFRVQAPVDVSDATQSTVVNSPVAVGEGGLKAEVTLTNESTQATPGEAKAAVKLPAGTEFKDDAGNPITESLLPPQEVSLPEGGGFPPGAVGIELGLTDARVNLSSPVVMQVTVQGPTGGAVPKVFLLLTQGPPAVFELAGISGTVDGQSYVPGGTALGAVDLGNGFTEYLLGLLLDHMSLFVPSEENLVPFTVPSEPLNVKAVRGEVSGSAQVSWTAPVSDGGTTLTPYVMTVNPGGATFTSSGLSLLVTGLSNGINYTFTVVAHNSVGPSPASAPSNAVIPATTPDKPTNVVATIGNGQSTVTWTAPASNGSAITAYKLTSTPPTSERLVSGAQTAYVFTGLSNGTQYTFTVTARNEVGDSQPSVASNAVTPALPATAPGAPGVPTAVAGDGQATVTWTAPGVTGGSAITRYTIIPRNVTDGVDLAPVDTADGVTLSRQITGLTNGKAYTFTVTATNDAGTSGASASSTPVTPTAAVTKPGAPTIASATPGNGQVTVAWAAASDGGSTITGYTVTGSPGGSCSVGNVLSCTIIGLANGTSYTFTVEATNAVGTGDPSSSVAATPRTTPGAPAIGTATAGTLEATVTWTAPTDNGGAVITGYTVTGNPGGGCSVGNVLSCTVTGLTAGATYTFTVQAVNAAGAGQVSGSSNAVTPAAPSTGVGSGVTTVTTFPPGAPQNVTAEAGDGRVRVRWIAGTTGGTEIISFTIVVDPGGVEITGIGGGVSVKDVTDLVNGVTYTFSVKATNARGTGPASESVAATPLAPEPPKAKPTAKDTISVTVDVKPTVSAGASAKDATGAVVEVSAGVKVEVKTQADGTSVVVLPVK
ncbi:MAG: fibronectin type III domain-containing protein, partial [Chloroflexi bacterium]|nr:fibronectin type III domain-containing protein [Chloroflexota bacterium]